MKFWDTQSKERKHKGMFFFNDTNIYIRVLNRFGFSYLSMQSGLGWALYIISSYHFLDLGSMVNRTWDHSSSTTSLIYWTSKFSAQKKKKRKMGLQYLSLVYSSLHYISPRYARIYSSKNIFCEFFLSKNESLLIEKVGKRTLSCLIYFFPPFSTFFLMRIEAKKERDVLSS